MKILGIATSNHWTPSGTDSPSKSLLILEKILEQFKNNGHSINLIEANKLHIVENQGCYSEDGKKCGSKDAGPYRCWAHYNSIKEPEKYGGKDEMPLIYDGIKHSDIVIFATPVRWFSHSAVLQRIIERLNVIDNLSTVFGEPPPYEGKKAGIIVIGHNYKADEVLSHLSEVLRWFRFTIPDDALLSWQGVNDINSENTIKDKDLFQNWLNNTGKDQLTRFQESFFKPKKSIGFHNRTMLKVLSSR